MKNKWMIPVVLFVVLVIAYMIRGFIGTRVIVEMLQTDKIEEAATCSGVLIRNEKVNTVSVDGIAEILAKNGQRVSKGELLAIFYSGTKDTVGEDIISELADINKRIEAIKAGHSGDAIFINDVAKIESEIANDVDKIISLVSNRNTEEISKYKYHISTLADQKAVAKGEKEGFANELARLQAEKSTLESKLGSLQKVIQSDMPGIFIEGRDGFEDTLTVASIETLTPDIIKETVSHEKNDKVETVEEGTYIYKIADNYSYYIAVNIDESLAKDLNTGDSVSLRFTDFATGNCPAHIKYISEKDKDGTVTVVSECNTHVEGLLEKRVVNVDFVKKSVSGYKVSIDNLHTVDNAVGLFIKRGAVMKFIPVTIIYSTEEEAIVTYASSEKPLKAYDEVVTSAPEFADGKVIAG